MMGNLHLIVMNNSPNISLKNPMEIQEGLYDFHNSKALYIYLYLCG